MITRALLVVGVLALGACASSNATKGKTTVAKFDIQSLIGSEWLAEDIDNRGVLDRLQSRLSFSTADQVSGFGGCNQFSGKAELDGSKVSFGPLGATRKMCDPSVMDQEDRFMKALARVRSARSENGLLYLMDEAGTAILRFSKL